MTNGVSEKIIERIKKLLSLAQSNNENEALSSLSKARELMAKYKIEMAEVKNKEEQKEEVINGKVEEFTHDGRSIWKSLIVKIVADNFGCYCYIDEDKKFVILGKETDVSICKGMITFAIKIVEKEGNKLANSYKKMGYSTRGLKKEYGIGFARGLEKKFEEQNQQQDNTNAGYQLMVVKDKEVENAYNKLSLRTAKSQTKRYNNQSEAYSRGYAEGKRFSANGTLA